MRQTPCNVDRRSARGLGRNKETAAATARGGIGALGLNGVEARNAALYFPRVIESDPQLDGQLDTFVPVASSPASWPAPTASAASGKRLPARRLVNGTQRLQANLNDAENGMLNPLGINCLRVISRRGASRLGRPHPARCRSDGGRI